MSARETVLAGHLVGYDRDGDRAAKGARRERMVERADAKRARKAGIRIADETIVVVFDLVTKPQRSPSPTRRGQNRHVSRGSSNKAKRNIIAAARALGWKGKSYRKAVRFGRALDRAEKAGGR